MKISMNWLGRYLDAGGLTPDQAEHALTFAGFPIESTTPGPDGDSILDVEVTSNRGDCLSHLGVARELSAITGRALRPPAIPAPSTSGRAESILRLENHVPDACPLFIAQVIRGVRVGPSPAWLVRALESVGQRSISNVVDVTNFLNFELGQPAHVFDLARLEGAALVLRWSRPGESLTTLDGKSRTLRPNELVVADAARAQSLAGVMGGAASEVSASTVDVVLETATWEPAVVRRAARAHGLRTDASHRFERIVDPRTIEFAARRAAALILEVAGGSLAEGMLIQGRPALPPARVRLRAARCGAILGAPVEVGEIVRRLNPLGITTSPVGEGVIECQIPPHRPDLSREIDLIEEVARLRGLDAIAVAAKLPIAVRAPQASERATREIASTLTGMGFFEAVTFSFVTKDRARGFLREGLAPLAVDDARRGADGTLRPSLVPSLIECRRVNQDRHASAHGGVRLFECASTFAQTPLGELVERWTLALLMDSGGDSGGRGKGFEEKQAGFRLLRGAVEAVVECCAGPGVTLRPAPPPHEGCDPAACAVVELAGQGLGYAALLSPKLRGELGLESPLAIAELDLDALVGKYPPRRRVVALPEFPHIDRDLSLVVEERVPWSRVESLARGAGIPAMEAVEFVSSYRGAPYGKGRKSLTLRLRFREPTRTLRHDEADAHMARIMDLAARELGAEIRK